MVVPCWVRDMSDDEAYMQLVLQNAQGELHPLEIGLHAVKSGKGLRPYADQTKYKVPTLQHRWDAATVALKIIDVDNVQDLRDVWWQLAEIRHTKG